MSQDVPWIESVLKHDLFQKHQHHGTTIFGIGAALTTIMMVPFESCRPALPFGTIIDDLAATVNHTLAAARSERTLNHTKMVASRTARSEHTLDGDRR